MEGCSHVLLLAALFLVYQSSWWELALASCPASSYSAGGRHYYNKVRL